MGQDRAFTAPRALLYIGNYQIGWVTNFTARRASSEFDIRVLGSVFSQGHETTAIAISGDIGSIHILRKPLAAAIANGQLLIPRGTTVDIIRWEPLPLALMDQNTGRWIWGGKEIKFTDQNWTIATGSVMTKGLSFVGIDGGEHTDSVGNG